MIDPADKQTADLPLEEKPAKRGRGRPATGKAMTPAEKQKAYRERLKQRQASTASSEELARVKREKKEIWNDARDVCADFSKRLVEAETELAKARAEIERLKSGNVTDIPYHVQRKIPGKRSWKTIGGDGPENEPFRDWQAAEAFAKMSIADGSGWTYRIVPAYLPVKEYK